MSDIVIVVSSALCDSNKYYAQKTFFSILTHFTIGYHISPVNF